jgi:mono/diheme cytochrome c family protein
MRPNKRQILLDITGFRITMVTVERQRKLPQNSSKKKLFGLGIGIAAICLFAPPLLSGSNHSCPVLRQKDLERGPSARAIPAFARKYNVDCTYCHTAWPQLNRVGYMFRLHGYRMPWEIPGAGGSPSASAPENVSPTPPAVVSGIKKGVTKAEQQEPTTTAQEPAAAKQAAGPEKIAEGQKVFQQMQCFTCHLNGENLIDPSKPLKGEGFRKKYPEDSQIEDLIRKGRPGTAMPAYNKQRLSDAQMSSLIAYIRSLTPQQ